MRRIVRPSSVICLLVSLSALLIWGNFGAPSPEMVRGSREKVMGIDSPYVGLLACANALGVSLEIGELLGDSLGVPNWACFAA